MADIELQVTGDDLSALLRQKVGVITKLEIQLTTLSRVVAEKDKQIENLEAALGEKESTNAKGRKEEIPIHQ